MRVLLRADASPEQGAGHVMRCIALSEEFFRRGHEVFMLTNQSGIEWLEVLLQQQEIQIIRVSQHELSENMCLKLKPDLFIVDSYVISPISISNISTHATTLAIIDGDTRGILADRYLDQNLGAENTEWPEPIRGRVWAGSEYSIIRDEILLRKKEVQPQTSPNFPSLIAFMGGTDPTGSILEVVEAIMPLHDICRGTIVTSPQWREKVEEITSGSEHFQVVTATRDLPKLIASADIAISASGTSAWDLLTLGIPSILIAVVDNQIIANRRIVEKNLALGTVRNTNDEQTLVHEIQKMLLTIIKNKSIRENLSSQCHKYFDGAGKAKLVEKLEAIVSS